MKGKTIFIETALIWNKTQKIMCRLGPKLGEIFLAEFGRRGGRVLSRLCREREREGGDWGRRSNTTRCLTPPLLDSFCLVIWTNTFGNSDKSIWKCWQIHSAIWTTILGEDIRGGGRRSNTSGCLTPPLHSSLPWFPLPCNLDKYNWKFKQICFWIWTNTFGKLDKYILQIGQIHF